MEEEIKILWIEYWSKSDIRNSIFVMHVEKNVSDNIIGMLLNIKETMKVSINAHKDQLRWVFIYSYNHNLW